MKRLLPLGLALACTFAVPQAQGNNCNRLQPCLDRCAKELADCQDTDYLCNIENTHCKERCQEQHEARISMKGKKISHYARDCIWANYPEMQGAINLINRKADYGLIDYAMYPNQEISNPRNIPVTTKKIPKNDMDTPHYWLLLRICYPGTRTYKLIFEGSHDHLGIPTPIPGTGVWYFARGLKSRSPDNESDLLKALYIAAVGDPQPVEPIINGTFMDVPGVREKVREWKEKGLTDHLDQSDEWIHLLAYHRNILTKADFRDKELVELSLGMLMESFRDHSFADEEKNHIYWQIVSKLLRMKKLSGYDIHYLEEGHVHVSSSC